VGGESHSADGQAPAPGLLILTGASHTGKTSVARELLGIVSPPAALLAVDDTLRHQLVRPPGDPWQQIPLTYELLRPQVEVLLDHNWLVIFESTFTYVRTTGEAEFHADELRRLVQVAEERLVPHLVVQLRATGAEVRARARLTGRLAERVVEQTAKLHDSPDLPHSVLRLDSGNQGPADLAKRSLAALCQRSSIRN